MELLELRGLFATYEKINKAKRNEVYYNDYNNNLILFSPHHKECDTESICNGITNEPYSYLINILNTTKNLVVYWSQVEGTTSDYNIYYDLDPSMLKGLSHKEITKHLSESYDSKGYTLKYNIVKNRVINGITREEMKTAI